MLVGVNIRRTIEDLLGDERKQEALRASPEDYFADQGIDDVPAELIGRAFVHYSDAASIEGADAVAGIATRYSDVPLENSDLPHHDPEIDPFATIGSLPVGAETIDPFGDIDADSGIDAPDDSASWDQADPDVAPTRAQELGSEHDDAEFGTGRPDDLDDTSSFRPGVDPDDDPFFEEVTADAAPILTVGTEHPAVDPTAVDPISADPSDDFGDPFADLELESDDGYSDIDPGDFDEI